MDTTFDHIRDVLVQMLGVEPDKVKMESRLAEDLEVNQLGFIEILMNVEEQFNVQIPDDEIANLHTVGDLVNYVDSQIASFGTA